MIKYFHTGSSWRSGGRREYHTAGTAKFGEHPRNIR